MFQENFSVERYIQMQVVMINQSYHSARTITEIRVRHGTLPLTLYCSYTTSSTTSR